MDGVIDIKIKRCVFCNFIDNEIFKELCNRCRVCPISFLMLFQQLSLLLIEIFVHRAFLVNSSTHSAHLNLLYEVCVTNWLCQRLKTGFDNCELTTNHNNFIWFFIGVVKNAKGGSATLIFTTYSAHQI